VQKQHCKKEKKKKKKKALNVQEKARGGSPLTWTVIYRTVEK
jgi:hypothetical protein